MNFKTIADLNKTIKDNLYKIPTDIDLIVGVPRSWMLPATILWLYLNCLITDIDSFCKWEIYTCGGTKKWNYINYIKDARKIIVIEDSSSSWESVKKAKEKISQSKYWDKCIFWAVYVTNISKSNVDIYFEICPQPRLFERNYIHHSMCKSMCFDIDWVLCENPTEEQNDDWPKYIDFILNAKPKFRPTAHIWYLVTTRLEKYRKETEIRLKNNNISYDKLIMLNLKTKEDRQKLNMYWKFKWEVYKKQKDSILFIESDYKQALEIAQISKKPVFCTENSQYTTSWFVQNLKTDFIPNLMEYKIIRYIYKILPTSIKKMIIKILLKNKKKFYN